MTKGATTGSGDDEPDAISTVKALAVSPAETSNARLRIVLTGMHPTQLPKLSHRMRAWSNFRRPFDELTPEMASKLVEACPDRIAVASALSMHHNGRVRQIAIEALQGVADPLALPFILLRCGEWVAAVRQPALRAVEPWLSPEHIDALLRSFPLLSGGRFATGRPSQHLPSRFLELFDLREAKPALMRNVTSLDTVTRRAAVRLLIEREPTIQLLEQAATTRDTVAIGLAARALPTDGETNKRAGNTLIRQPAPRLRQEGLFRLLKEGGPNAETLARTYMLDRALTVRSTAQRWFSEAGGDIASHYRSLPPTERHAALLGLGDKAEAQDAIIARQSLGERAVVRRAALRLLAKLGDHRDFETFADCLLNGSEREAREALVWFGKSGAARQHLDQLNTLSQTEKSVTRLLLRLGPLTDNWSQLAIGLRACTDPRPAVRDAAAQLIRRATNQPNGFLSPAADRLAELRSLLEPARTSLDTQPTKWGQPTLTERVAHLLRDR